MADIEVLRAATATPDIGASSTLHFVDYPTDDVTRDMIATDATPGADKTHPHYCPICMMSFVRAFASTCCNNNICELCFKDLIDQAESGPLAKALMTKQPKAKGCKDAATTRVPGFSAVGAVTLSKDEDLATIVVPVAIVCCPFCSRTLRVKALRSGCTSRSYAESPSVLAAMQRLQRQHSADRRGSACKSGEKSLCSPRPSSPTARSLVTNDGFTSASPGGFGPWRRGGSRSPARPRERDVPSSASGARLPLAPPKFDDSLPGLNPDESPEARAARKQAEREELDKKQFAELRRRLKPLATLSSNVPTGAGPKLDKNRESAATSRRSSVASGPPSAPTSARESTRSRSTSRDPPRNPFLPPRSQDQTTAPAAQQAPRRRDSSVQKMEAARARAQQAERRAAEAAARKKRKEDDEGWSCVIQ